MILENQDLKTYFKPNINFQNEMEKEIDSIVSIGKKRNLLLHSCCAPCSSCVLVLLRKFFNLTVYFYNTNIYPEQEYEKRLNQQIRFIGMLNSEIENENSKLPDNDIFKFSEIKVIKGDYEVKHYYDFIKGHEADLEKGYKCFLCYSLRIDKTAQMAKKLGFDYFTSTLSVSPHKNSLWVNICGDVSSKKHNIKFLHSDFKKNDGYRKSIELSKKYGLYRQKYCGCVYSLSYQK